MNQEPIAVCSRSFSKNPILRSELLAQYMNVKFNDDGLELKGDALVNFLMGQKKAIIALEKIDADTLSQLPQLEVIAKYGVGLDMIDMDAMRLYKKRLGWEAGVNRRSVSELVIALAITLLRQLHVCNQEVLSGIFRQRVGEQLSGKTIGIIGCGHVGKDLIKLLVPFNCTVLVYDIANYPDFYSSYGVTSVTLNDLLSQSDIVTLHIPLNETTRLILNEDRLSLLKKNAILINTARGGLIDERALKSRLINNEIAGAAFDVFSPEPPTDIELLNLPNFFGTPHIGGSSVEAVLAMGRAAIKGLSINGEV